MELQPIFDILGQKYFGIPLALLLIGFSHLGLMTSVLFGQTLLEFFEKKMSK
jgi:uncharacterized membrane protein